MNAQGTPANVFSGHAPNELTDFRWDRPATPPPVVVTRFPGPIQAKTLAVSTHQGVGLEDVQRLETTRADAVQPDPEQALASTQTYSFAISLSDHGQLLSKREDSMWSTARLRKTPHSVASNGRKTVVNIESTLTPAARKSQPIQPVRSF